MDELTIQFTVVRKLSPELLAVGGLRALPASIVADDGTEVPVDVVECSYRPSYQIIQPAAAAALATPQTVSPKQMRRRRLATIVPGISVSNPTTSVGTIAAVVFDALNGTPYVLSNWHVLQGPFGGTIGDTVVQPGTYDDSNIGSNALGRLIRSHLGLAGDCAVASINGRGIDANVLELNVTPRRVAKANVGDEVVKSSRTTGVTHGIVNRVGVVFNIDYGGDVGVRQVGGFEIRPNPSKPPPSGQISDEGDSGGLWMVDTAGADKDVALGLHFGEQDDPTTGEERAIACNIHSVFEKLQISFTP
jgi:endonuclease G